MTAKRRPMKPGFEMAGVLRMPAPTMGRRAVRTSALIQEKARVVFLLKGYHGTNIEDKFRKDFSTMLRLPRAQNG